MVQNHHHKTIYDKIERAPDVFEWHIKNFSVKYQKSEYEIFRIVHGFWCCSFNWTTFCSHFLGLSTHAHTRIAIDSIFFFVCWLSLSLPPSLTHSISGEDVSVYDFVGVFSLVRLKHFVSLFLLLLFEWALFDSLENLFRPFPLPSSTLPL